MTQEESDTGPQGERAQLVPRLRATFAALTGLVAVLGLVTSLVAGWARDTLFDPNEVSAAVEAALERPDVTDALAAYLTDQVVVAVGVEEYVTGVLPPNLSGLAPAITGGVRSFVSGELADVLADEDVRAVIVTLAERSHRELMRLLDGDGIADGVTIVDGEVSVNLLPLIGRGLRFVQELGLLSSIVVPQLAADGDPAVQRAELEAALGRELPPAFGELVVYRSEAIDEAQNSLAAAQRIVVLVKRAMFAVMLLTVVAAALSIWLSRRRVRTTLVLLLAGVAAMVVVRALGALVIARSPTLAVQPGARAAIRSIVGSLASGLITAASIVAIAGMLVAAGVWLAGDSPTAVRLRGGAGTTTGSFAGLVATHGDLLAFAGYAAGLLVILVGGIGAPQVVIAVLLALAGWVIGRRAGGLAS